MLKPLAKRFYKTASVSARRRLQFCSTAARSRRPPNARCICQPAPLAEAIAAEWNAQGAEINPAHMPLTRFANTALDAVSQTLPEVAADIVSYAGRDLLCYRAAAPADLVRAQSAMWDPVIAWFDETLWRALARRRRHHAGRSAACRRWRQSPRHSHPHDAFRLTALHVMTTLTGSALLSLAHAQGFLSADDAWAAAHVDEDHQIALWGEDYEAATAAAAAQTTSWPPAG